MEKNLRSYENEQFPDWSIEEFDAISEDHVFSEQYQREKRKVIRAHSKKKAPRRYFMQAVAAAAACIVLPVVVYAAVTHADFYQNAFGNAGRQSVSAHEEVLDDGKGGQLTVTYPEREYVPIDEEMAEALIGSNISSEPVEVQINDHTLTINSAVRDENAIVMEFTLECETGVTALNYSELDNEAKGAFMSEESTFHFMVDGTAENIYVDLEKSTETCLHCYYYGLFVFDGPLADGKSPTLDITYADEPLVDIYMNEPLDGSHMDESLDGNTDKSKIHEAQVAIPAEHTLDLVSFTSEAGGVLDLSPISLSIDMGKGLGLTNLEAYDPIHLNTMSIHYTDGSSYQVYDRDGNVDNTAYMCGGCGAAQTEIMLLFNRLIDPSKIDYVEVNGLIYNVSE
ncbi:MAG: hypothetical protein IKF22_00015 [Lachnospiraceae bacterium]|nr:hypothetical protein [Lachnospiraceae bacterium]